MTVAKIEIIKHVTGKIRGILTYKTNLEYTTTKSMLRTYKNKPKD